MSFPTRHQHNFSSHNQKGEKRTFYVLLLTIITMVVEIVAGTIYGSMALLADGWHMGTHAAAFGITLFAYRYAKKHADSERFSFGTGKVSVLGGRFKNLHYLAFDSSECNARYLNLGHSKYWSCHW